MKPKLYREKLKDPRWQKRRLDILNRDEFRCRLCNAGDETLHVHHKHYSYWKDPWDYKDNELITLCEDCHEKHHSKSLYPVPEGKSLAWLKIGRYWDGENYGHLVCPSCGCDCMHHDSVEEGLNKGDDAVNVRLFCENCNYMATLSIAQHEGHETIHFTTDEMPTEPHPWYGNIKE
jgi:hypothetical protein